MSSAVPGIEPAAVEKYRFEDFELFPRQRALWRGPERMALMPKPLDTLIALVERAGQTVTKEELLDLVWSGSEVEENNLTQSISLLRKVLGEKRGDNRFIVTDSGRGYRFVAAVSRVMDTTPAPAPAPAPSARTARKTIAYLSCLLLFTGAIGFWALKRYGARAVPRRPSVAVVRIRDLSKSTTEAWLQTALAEMLTSELAAGGKLRTIPAEDVARWRSDWDSTPGESRQADVLRSAWRNLGADSLVLGSYVVNGPCPNCRVRVDLGVLNARTGERVGTVIEEGGGGDLLDLASRLGQRLRAEFRVEGEGRTAPKWPVAGAMREYAEGLKALRLTEPVAARAHLEAAVADDPGNALIHLALADAWTALGSGTRANEESRRAYELSESLSRLERLGIEAHYRAALGEWGRAIEIYKAIFQLFPDSLEDGLNLARTQMHAPGSADAASTLRSLRALPAPAGTDPRIDLIEAQAAGIMNDYPRTRAMAHHAAEEAQARGARYLFARARLLEGGAMQTMGDAAFAAVQDEARRVCEEIGDRDCLSKAWRIRGNARFSYGDFQGAQQAYAQGVAIARELGNRAELANLLVGFGVVAKANRDWRQAEQNFVEAAALRAETGFSPSEVQLQLAGLYIEMGRFADAAQVLESAFKPASQVAAHEDLGEIYTMQALLSLSRGELSPARQLNDKALAELRPTQGRQALTLALAQSSSIAAMMGDLKRAEKDLAEAGSSSAPEIEGVIQLARAELRNAQGRFDESVSEAQRSAADFDKAHADDGASRAFLIEADAFEMLHRDDQALAACREAGTRATRTSNQLRIAFARVCEWRATRTAREAPAFVHTQNLGFSLAFDYARAMRDRRAGHGNSRAQFEALARTAAAGGYETLARRALSLAQAEVTGSFAR